MGTTIGPGSYFLNFSKYGARHLLAPSASDVCPKTQATTLRAAWQVSRSTVATKS